MADDQEAFQLAHAAGVELPFQRAEVAVEAAVEAEEQGLFAAQLRRGALGGRQVLIDRLFAQHGLAGGDGLQRLVEVLVGRRGHDNTLDRRIGQHGVEGADGRTRFGSQRGCAVAHGVDDGLEIEARMGGRVFGVDAADAARADNGDVEHDYPPRLNRPFQISRREIFIPNLECYAVISPCCHSIFGFGQTWNKNSK